MLGLRYSTPPHWIDVVWSDFNRFLQDHAANERKVAIGALTLANQHPRRTELVRTLIDVAQEEMAHLKQVHDLLLARGSHLGFDVPDRYMGALHKAIRNPSVEHYLLDRLVLFGVVEARGCERFGLVAESANDSYLADFYRELTRSEARHHGLYLGLARTYFDAERVAERLDYLLELEAKTISELPLRPALH